MTVSIQLSKIWSEINHEFKKDSSGGVKIDTNIDAVKSSVANILGTRQGSRVMLPTFAETYTDFLFDPIDSHLATYLSDKVKEVIETWDDRVTVVDSQFISDPDNNKISITVSFIIRGYQNILEITHNF